MSLLFHEKIPVGVYDWVCHTKKEAFIKPHPSAGLEENHHVMALLLGSWARQTPMVSTVGCRCSKSNPEINVTYSTHFQTILDYIELSLLVGGLELFFKNFSMCWECHHPN